MVASNLISLKYLFHLYSNEIITIYFSTIDNDIYVHTRETINTRALDLYLQVIIMLPRGFLKPTWFILFQGGTRVTSFLYKFH